MMDDSRPMTPAQRRTPWNKLVVLVTVVIAIVVGYSQFGDTLSLDYLAKQEHELRQLQRQHPWLVYGIAFLVYVVVTGLSLPFAAALSLVFGWYFGFVRAVVLVSFGSTAGATMAFLLSRYLFRDWIEQQFGQRLATIDRALEKEGAFYLFAIRLTPAIPFFVVNVVMGLTPIGAGTFWWISQLGMLPGTCVYVYAGASVPGVRILAEQGAIGILSPQLMIAFVVLGVFPLVIKKWMQHFRPAAVVDAGVSAEEGSPNATVNRVGEIDP